MRREVFCCTLLALGLACPGLAQKTPGHERVISERETLPVLGEKPDAVLKIEKLKGRVKKVDLEKRTVTIAHQQSESTFTFPTAAGREKVSLSKKASKLFGKKSLRLEELPAGSEVKVQYYPTLGSILEIVVEEPGK